MQVHNILVLGAGTMGSSIAQCAVQNGFHVTIYDAYAEQIDKSQMQIKNSFSKLLEKGKYNEEQINEFNNSLVFETDIYNCIADFVIEAVVENIEIKSALFNQLSEIMHSDLVFATNTSSLSISELQNSIHVNPARVVGMHFFNPATIMPLVEIISGNQSNKESIDIAASVAERMNKKVVHCIDTPGFIVNRVARPYYLEALRILEKGNATIEDIDNIMVSCGFKMGPFTLMDTIGIDINYTVSKQVYEALQKPKRLEPSVIQANKITENKLGRKTGEGFYKY